MPRKESRYPADWLRIAEKDLRRAVNESGAVYSTAPN